MSEVKSQGQMCTNFVIQ